MAFNFTDGESLKKLRDSIRWSEDKLDAFRRLHKNMLKQYVGKHYGTGGASDRVPINLIELGINIFQRQIASSTPSALVTTMHKELKPVAYKLQLAMNYKIRKMQLENALNTAGIEALFMMGVLKIGIAFDDSIGPDDGGVADPGDLFVEPVLFEDFIVDMGAKRWDKVGYMGNRYRMPLDWVKNNPAFDEEVRSQVTRSTSGSIGKAKESQSDSISKGSDTFREEYEESVNLIDLWIPSERRVVTLAGDQEHLQPLAIVDWTGPRHGPYHILSFETVPGNLIPLSPAALWMDLHEITNRLANKVVRQAQDQKTVLGVAGHAKDDGDRTVRANDGEAILMENPDGLKEFRFNGADQQTMATVIWAKDMFTYMAGNLDSIGGLGSQSGTLGQDTLLRQSSSQRVQDMQQRMARFTKNVVADLAWYVWNDPLIDVPLQIPIGQTGLHIEDRFDATSKNGDFFSFNFDVEPYSLQSRTPTERLSSVVQFAQTILFPVLPALQQSGIGINFEKFFKMFGEYMNLPEIADILIYGDGEKEPQDGPTPPPPGKPMATTRHTIREGRSGGTRRTQDMQMMAHMMGANRQPAEQRQAMG
jgi:hypothetical protein